MGCNLTTCKHPMVCCLNPYEFIRKYRCPDCSGIIMCACDEELGRRFFAHQLGEAVELETQQRIPVTLGFQAGICNRCRGLPEETHPKAQIYGRTSRIQRYYWREIWFETIRRFAAWTDEHGYTDVTTPEAHPEYARLERQVIQDIRTLHKRAPKYEFLDEPQSETIAKNKVEIVNLQAIYVKHTERKALVLNGENPCTVEDFTKYHFEALGYQVLRTESRPFHALFGVFFWLLIEDPGDPNGRIVGFGERSAERGQNGKTIWLSLPEDFGTPGYASRRKAAIDEHFSSMLTGETQQVLWTFDYWAHHSTRLREYLWAHRPEDVRRAREILAILGADIVRRILRYLIAHYWGRFCGWPDFLIHNNSEYFFAEVKSSGDELSEDQKNWIRGNHRKLALPFKLIKIHRQGLRKVTP